MIMRLLLALALICGLASPALAQSQTTIVPCTGVATYDASTSGATKLVSAKETNGIYVCGYTFNSTASVKVQLQFGTGTACGTGTTNLTPAYQLSPVVADPSPAFRGMYVPPGNDLCISTSAGQPVQAVVYFSQPR
jgi:hypothetical protein